MKLYKILFVFVSLLFISCSEQIGVLEKTNGLVQTDIKPSILFDTEVANNNTPIVASGEIQINGNYFVGSYVFNNGNRITLLPDEPFSAGKKYEIKFDFDLINKNSGSNIALKNFKMSFETKSLEAQIQEASFVRDTQFVDKIKLESRLELSQDIPLKDIKDSLKFLDSSGNEIEVDISRDSSQANTYDIYSILLDSPKEKDEVYSLILDKNSGLQKEIKHKITASKILSLDVVSTKVVNGDKTSIEVKFSESLDNNINLSDFIRISPKVKFSVSQVDNIINITGNFAQDSDYTIEILKGIKSLNSKLEKDVKLEIKTSDIAPKILFSNDGVFLPDVNNKKIAFRSINVKKANVVIKKVYMNNITQFLNNSSLIKNNTYDYWIYNFEYIGDTIKEMSIDINSPKNTWVQNEIDLSYISDTNGIFIVSMHFSEEDIDYRFPAGTADWKRRNYFYDNGNVYKQLIFSNMALVAQSFYDGNKFKMIASAIDIRNNKPLSGVDIQSVSGNNQVISSGVTDKDGNVILDYYSEVNTKKIYPFYLSGMKDGDFAILHLNSTKLSLDGFDVGGVSDTANIKAFIYTDRGVYRPGDSVHLNIIARNGSKAIEHPIKLTITTPRNKKQISELSLSPSTNGMYYYEFVTDRNADTGTYNVSIDIGGNIFNHKVAIETIVPNRIKVDINAQDEIDLKVANTIEFGIQSDYLFGAPASGLEYSLDVAIRPKDFISKKYRDYVFDNKTNLRYQDNKRYDGILNDNGFAQRNINIGNINKIDKNLEAVLIARVFENNGRQVNNRKIVNLKMFDSFVGIKKPTTRYIKQDENVNLSVVLIDEDEKPISGRKLKYKVYNNSYSWWWDYNSYEQYTLSIKSDRNTKLVYEGEINTNDKVNNINFKVKDRGEILVEVIDSTNNQSASIFLYSSSWGEPLDVDKITQLQIKTDKKEYTHNDTAKIIFESVKNGRALITISDSNNILDRYWIDTKDGQSIVDVKIDERYSPNLYASVLLLQDYQNNDNDRSLRLYGVVPINIVNDKTRLNVDIQASEEILPNSDLNIKISNKENKQVTYTIALVDEGLLGLTNFASPSPWDYFYAKMKYNIDTFDTYSYVINKTTGRIEKVYSIGGDAMYESAARQDRQKDDSAERFKPVAFFVKPIQSDSSGNANFTFKIPSYLGSLRVMVVAVDNDRFGSADKNIRVSAPVVMLPTIPRSLKINDSFKIPVEVMPIKDGVKNAKISISSDGIVKFDTESYDLSFSDKKSKTIFFEGRVREELGIENISITLKSGDFSMKDSTQIDIKAPNPYTTLINNFVINSDNKSATINAPSSFVNKSNVGKIIVSTTPIISIDHRLLWLMRYPYGCIEQTTSSVFPQLFIGKLSNADFIDKQTMIDNVNAGIARIALFQTSDGGFSYWKGQGSSDFWGSNYASHFLFMAKKQGFAVSDDMLNRVLDYQTKNARNQYNDMYPIYLLALSGNMQLGIMNEVYENNLRNLSITNRWLLAASYKLAGFDDIASKISANLSVEPNDSYDYYSYSYGSSLRSKAMILEAYKIVNNEIHKDLYNDIKNALEGDKWLSTQTTSYALLVLASIKDEAKKSNIEGVITINNKKQSFNKDTNKLVFDLNDGNAKVESNKNLFINYTWEGIIADNAGDNISKKMHLKREFVEIDNYGNEVAINPRNLKSSKSFYVKLTLEKIEDSNYSSRYLENVALVQNLPSGWEIENTRLNDDPLPDRVERANSTITYTDIRDDKIMWFFDLYNKAQVVYVKINAVTPGNYTLPPAYAEAMYDGSYQASTDSFRINVFAK